MSTKAIWEVVFRVSFRLPAAANKDDHQIRWRWCGDEP